MYKKLDINYQYASFRLFVLYGPAIQLPFQVSFFPNVIERANDINQLVFLYMKIALSGFYIEMS